MKSSVWRWILVIVIALIVLIGSLLIWNKLEYFTPNPIIPHNKVVITLPYSKENEATNLIPMGETIAHNFYGGHPGIDFQWDHSVPLIAVADGKITNVSKDTDMGETVLNVTLDVGGYLVQYKELDKVAEGIVKGASVKKGQIIGYPHGHYFSDGGGHTGYQVHWEFGYDMFSLGFERLCPLTYFDPDALVRINKLWDSVSSNDQFKQKFPNICNNIYLNRDQ